MRVSLACRGAVLALTMSAGAALAEPSGACLEMLSGERLTIAVPNSPGGGYDTYARSLAPAVEANSELTVRVTNMPGAGGLAARGYVMNAEPDDLAVLIENTADLVTSPMEALGRGSQAGKDVMIDGYEIVGILHTEPTSWLARADLDIRAPDLDRLVGSEGSIEEALLPLIMAGMVLGIDVDVVAGYDGTGEMAAAILRGEADFSSMSVTTASRRAQDEGLKVAMILSVGPSDSAPEIPYLAGEGSVGWDLTADLPEDEAADLRSLANAVARLRNVARGLFVSTNMPADRRACVAEIMDAAIADPLFIEAAEAQGRPVSGMTAAEARDVVEGLRSAYADVRPTLDALTAELLGN